MDYTNKINFLQILKRVPEHPHHVLLDIMKHNKEVDEDVQ